MERGVTDGVQREERAQPDAADLSKQEGTVNSLE